MTIRDGHLDFHTAPELCYLGLTLWSLDPNSQALVYDILPSTAAVFSYAIGPRKLSANEQFFLLVLKQ